MEEFRGTTIVAVKSETGCAIAGDGQVSLGETTIMKHTAKKVRRITGASWSALRVQLRTLSPSATDSRPSSSSSAGAFRAPPSLSRRIGEATR